MLSSETQKFLINLAENNDRDWFNKHKDEYQASWDEFIQFGEEFIKQMQKADKSIPELEAKKCSFRIYRDVRFSKNKSPYKKHFALFISSEGKKTRKAGYYVHIEPGNTFAGAGAYLPEPKELQAIRQEIDYNPDEFIKLVTAKDFKKVFGGLDESEKSKSMPRGFDKESRVAEYIKLKSFFVETSYKDTDVFENRKFINKLIKDLEKVKDFVEFLNRAMD